MAKEAPKKVKCPTAQKRNLQNQKARLANKIYRSRVRTAIRSLSDSIESGDREVISTKLNDAYSILDKCVKVGVYKINKASRTKSRLAARAVAKA